MMLIFKVLPLNDKMC